MPWRPPTADVAGEYRRTGRTWERDAEGAVEHAGVRPLGSAPASHKARGER